MAVNWVDMKGLSPCWCHALQTASAFVLRHSFVPRICTGLFFSLAVFMEGCPFQGDMKGDFFPYKSGIYKVIEDLFLYLLCTAQIPFLIACGPLYLRNSKSNILDLWVILQFFYFFTLRNFCWSTFFVWGLIYYSNIFEGGSYLAGTCMSCNRP